MENVHSMLKRCLLVILMIGFTISAQSQEETFRMGEKVKIVLVNGTVIEGKLVAEDLGSYTVLMDGEQVIIPKDKVKRGVEVKRQVFIEEYRDFADQYFIVPSALQVGKGNSYYRNINLFGNIFSFGVSDNFSINGGFESASLIGGNLPGLIVTPKFSLPLSEDLHFGIGSTSFIFTENIGTTAFSNITYGDQQNNLTLGINIGIGDADFLNAPLFSVGYMFSLDKKVSLLGEFLFIDDLGYDALFDVAVRIKNRSGWAFDIGMVSTFEAIDNGAIPAIAVVIPL